MDDCFYVSEDDGPNGEPYSANHATSDTIAYGYTQEDALMNLAHLMTVRKQWTVR